MTTKPTIADYRGGSPFGDNETPPFKEGSPSTHDLGVLYQAPWEQVADGFNEHARRCARALALTGCPVHLRSFRGSVNVDPELRVSLAPLLDASIARYSVQIQQFIFTETIAQTMGMHRFLSEAELAVINQYRVLYSVWERDRVSPQIVTLLNRMGQVWVACWRNVDMLERCGVDRAKIKVVPVPYFDDDPLLKLRGRTRAPGPPHFYHIGKWEPRKAQDKILEAFMRAFRPGEATFVLKTSSKSPTLDGYPAGPKEAIQALLTTSAVQQNGWTLGNVLRSIFLVQKNLTDEQMTKLHAMGDIYVTLSRGEGFDMPAFDAKLAGNAMVFTPSGGSWDFAASDDYLVPERGSVPCHPFYGWEKDARYLYFDIDSAVAAMQQAARDVKPVRPYVGEPVSAGYRAEIVGENMLRNLWEVVGETGKVF